MRLLTAAAAGLALSLAACIEADMETTILGADEARVNGYIQVERAMVDMMGGADGFCTAEDGGKLQITNTHARCTITQTGTFAQIFEADTGGGPQPTSRDLGDGTVHVSFPLGDLSDEMGDMAADPNMIAMFRPMMEGGAITLRISGAQIVSSNGEISGDGRSSTMRFPLTDLVDRPDAIPPTFEAVVRY